MSDRLKRCRALDCVGRVAAKVWVKVGDKYGPVPMCRKCAEIRAARGLVVLWLEVE